MYPSSFLDIYQQYVLYVYVKYCILCSFMCINHPVCVRIYMHASSMSDFVIRTVCLVSD
jgi:hypothetical protein